MLLAIDTSTSLIGAAVHDGSTVLARTTHEDPRRHAELLAPAIRDTLDRAGVSRRHLTAVVVGVGPGPFTGLRVGIVTARVIALALGVPVHGVCSLDVLATEAAVAWQEAGVPHAPQGGGPVDLLVATDARRKEVYWARYAVAAGAAHRTQGPGVGRAVDLHPSLTALPALGRGPELYPEALHGIPAGPGGAVRDVDPGVLAALAARALDGDPGGVLVPPEPMYLRRPDAQARQPRVGSPPEAAHPC